MMFGINRYSLKNTRQEPNYMGGKPMYKCSANEQHKATLNQAKSSGWTCTHCGSDLAARKDKLDELHRLAEQLGYKIRPKKRKEK